MNVEISGREYESQCSKLQSGRDERDSVFEYHRYGRVPTVPSVSRIASHLCEVSLKINFTNK